MPAAGLLNTARAWGWPARALHWLSAALVMALWVLGQVMTAVPDEELARKLALYQLHKSLGLTALAIVLVRLGWRALNPRPDWPSTMPAWERHAAATGHALLYLLLLAMPLTGWLMVSASPWGIPTLLFGLVEVPHLLGPDAALEATLKSVHGALATLLAGLVLLHVAAALKHALFDRDGVLWRMVKG